jgi:hypothetical protein
MRGKHLMGCILTFVVLHLIMDLATFHLLDDPFNPCLTDSQRKLRLIMSSFLSLLEVPQCMWLCVIIYHLRRHSSDGWGLITEFKFLLISFWLMPLTTVALRVRKNTIATETLAFFVSAILSHLFSLR